MRTKSLRERWAIAKTAISVNEYRKFFIQGKDLMNHSINVSYITISFNNSNISDFFAAKFDILKLTLHDYYH